MASINGSDIYDKDINIQNLNHCKCCGRYIYK